MVQTVKYSTRLKPLVQLLKLRDQTEKILFFFLLAVCAASANEEEDAEELMQVEVEGECNPAPDPSPPAWRTLAPAI